MSRKTIAGAWRGALWGVEFSLEVKQSKSKLEGTVSALGESMPIRGESNPPKVTFCADSPKGLVSFEGRVENGETIEGSLNGGGFEEQHVAFQRD